MVSQDLSPDEPESEEFKMVRMEERWLPKDMVDDWDAVIKDIKETTPLGSLTEKKMTEEEKKQVMAMLDMVDQALDKAAQANTGQELMTSVMEAAGSVSGTMAAQSGGGGLLDGLFGSSGGGQGETPVGRTTQWTFGGGGKDLANWKGKVRSQQVLSLFGNPDEGKPWGQGGGAWTYRKLKITDAQGNPHSSVTFYMQKGQVVDIKLP